MCANPTVVGVEVGILIIKKIYIYVCVCVCVCVRMKKQAIGSVVERKGEDTCSLSLPSDAVVHITISLLIFPNYFLVFNPCY